MTDIDLKEALAPWAAVILVATIVAVAVRAEAWLVVSIAAWIGVLASVLYINYRFWGHPLKFGPDLEIQK